MWSSHHVSPHGTRKRPEYIKVCEDWGVAAGKQRSERSVSLSFDWPAPTGILAGGISFTRETAPQPVDTEAMPDPGEAPERLPAPPIGGQGLPTPFGSDYELRDFLGQGAMGQVYKAWQKSLRRFVAIKVVQPSRAMDEEALQRFVIEAQAAARLRHPNIVRVHEVGQHEGEYFFTMDFVDGPPLSRAMREGKLSLDQSLRLLEKVARAVHHAHENHVVHRDLNSTFAKMRDAGKHP